MLSLGKNQHVVANIDDCAAVWLAIRFSMVTITLTMRVS
jgi:hypothetical protein